MHQNHIGFRGLGFRGLGVYAGAKARAMMMDRARVANQHCRDGNTSGTDSMQNHCRIQQAASQQSS